MRELMFVGVPFSIFLGFPLPLSCVSNTRIYENLSRNQCKIRGLAFLTENSITDSYTFSVVHFIIYRFCQLLHKIYFVLFLYAVVETYESETHLMTQMREKVLFFNFY